MADPPDRQPGQWSLFELGVQRVEKRLPPEVDRAEVEREMEAKRQARMQHVADAAAAALAAKRPVGRPMGSGKKPAAAAAAAVAAQLDGASQAGEDISMSTPQPAPAPVAKYRAWTTAEKSFALGMLPICGDNLARTINWLHHNEHGLEPVNHWAASQ